MNGSYVCTVLLAKHPASYGVDRSRWRWRRLTGSSRDPYRPELHYMRGPGPACRAKQMAISPQVQVMLAEIRAAKIKSPL
jgi:hypothetical protein